MNIPTYPAAPEQRNRATTSPVWLAIMRHALGLDSKGKPPARYKECHDDDYPGCYRNSFAAAEGHLDWGDLLAMEGAGVMGRHKTRPDTRLKLVYFYVTRIGYEAAFTPRK